jgi:D-glycero-D-manno-heptose 1,7-bisphosphate phosphatase
MFEKAIRRFKADPSLCHMAGDKISDLQPAIKLGIKPHLIRSRFYESVDQDFIQKHKILVHNTLNELINKKFGM